MKSSMGLLCLLLFLLSHQVHFVASYPSWPSASFKSSPLKCSLDENLVEEIASYSWLVDNVTSLVLNGSMKGTAYQTLAQFVDTFGSRFTGSAVLEEAIDYLEDQLAHQGMENVHTEDVTVPLWKRGDESLSMLEPRNHTMALLGLGSSIGTPVEGITAEVVAVNDFNELDQRADEVPGKIVVYNQPYLGYGISVAYRTGGASKAAKYGAVAALVRSVTPRSIYSPHTGWQTYDPSVSPRTIPVACITVEDAEMMKRMTDRGTRVVVQLKMGAQNLGTGTSRNLVSEWTGRELPNASVIVSGHIDSWDVGQGAMDDGGGAFISLLAPIALRTLGVRPRRTLRTVLWTAEEPGTVGALEYAAAHAEELSSGAVDIVLESDGGTFNPKGLSFSGTDEAACIVQEILKLSLPLGASNLVRPDDGSDTQVFAHLGIPTGSLNVGLTHYFDYHHSNGDTMTVEDADQLDKCLAFWMITAFVLADLSIPLPHIPYKFPPVPSTAHSSP